MQAVSYGWWINSRLYQFNDPDMMKFAGGTQNENQSRLINCAVTGTVFLNSDDLASATGQELALTCLTNAKINEVARTGVSFRPVEGNTGTNATDIFVRQDANNWYVAVFNYTKANVSKTFSLVRLGVSGTHAVTDLWDGTSSAVSGTNWTVNLGPNQAKLFKLVATETSPTNLRVTLNSGQLTVNWPADHTGWRLQNQATLVAGPGAAWSDVPGSRQTNSWSFPISQTGPTLYFRLAWP